MVTKRTPARRPTRQLYVREWRKFMGTKPIDLAVALDIERQSYHRLEKNWHTINAGEIATICETIGIEPSQLWFPPPVKGEPEKVSIDDLLEDMPEDIQALARNAVRGMIGK